MRSPRTVEYLRYGDSTGGHDSCKHMTSILPPKLRNAARPAREHPVKPTSPAQPLITPSSLILPHTHTAQFQKNSFGREIEKNYSNMAKTYHSPKLFFACFPKALRLPNHGGGEIRRRARHLSRATCGLELDV